CGADWEPRFVDYFGGETRAPAFRENNEMGEVPVLEGRGLTLTQSGVILDYLAGEFGKFGPENEDERREILRWLLFDNHKLTSYTATLRFLRTFTDTSGPVVDFLRDRSNIALGVLDKHMENRSFAISERPTIADISMCGYLFWPDEIGVDWATDFPHIETWLERISNLPGWVHPYELMPGYPLPAK
ncbi:MAG: glutathione S-transferase family protein, partial [Gammaproteobacteria bacterium]|nr:glutathione S-transferase family protein [Gammaproteobacteria bacterium]